VRFGVSVVCLLAALSRWQLQSLWFCWTFQAWLPRAAEKERFLLLTL